MKFCSWVKPLSNCKIVYAVVRPGVQFRSDEAQTYLMEHYSDGRLQQILRRHGAPAPKTNPEKLRKVHILGRFKACRVAPAHPYEHVKLGVVTKGMLIRIADEQPLSGVKKDDITYIVRVGATAARMAHVTAPFSE